MEHPIVKLKLESGVGAVRVSSTKQGLQGDSPDDQKQQIENRARFLNSKVVRWFNFIQSASGEIQPSQEAIDYCKANQGKIKFFFIKSIDRFTRGGSYAYDHLKMQLIRYGVQLIDVYGVIGTQTVNTLEHLGTEYSWSKYNPTRVSELLEAERGKNEIRDILTRMIGAEIRYVRMGYRVRSAPFGYINQKIDTVNSARVILKPHVIESKWMIKMFELRIQGNLPDEEIVTELNLLGFKSKKTKIHDKDNPSKIVGYGGEKQLTLKQMRDYLENPIYAGVNNEKWMAGKPIKTKFPGLVTVEMFNKANRGKITILEEGDRVIIYKGTPPQWQLSKKKDNPLYPYKKYVLCPKCKKNLLGSAPRGKAGKYFPAYHCNRGHYFGTSLEKFDKTIKDFCVKIKFSDEFRIKFTNKILEEWDKREKYTSNKTITLNERLIQIEREKQMLKVTMKQLSSLTAIKMIEEDIDKLEAKKTTLVPKRDHEEAEQLNIQEVMNYIKYFMEHPQELLLGGSDKQKNAAMFGLLFETAPTYEELIHGTPQLSPLVALNEEYNKSKSLSVSPQGLEP